MTLTNLTKLLKTHVMTLLLVISKKNCFFFFLQTVDIYNYMSRGYKDVPAHMLTIILNYMLIESRINVVTTATTTKNQFRY